MRVVNKLLFVKFLEKHQFIIIGIAIEYDSPTVVINKTFERYLCEGVQEPLVIVISDSASILHLTQHVPHCIPRHTLQTRVY